MNQPSREELEGPLSGRELVPMAELADNPGRIDTPTRKRQFTRRLRERHGLNRYAIDLDTMPSEIDAAQPDQTSGSRRGHRLHAYPVFALMFLIAQTSVAMPVLRLQGLDRLYFRHVGGPGDPLVAPPFMGASA